MINARNIHLLQAVDSQRILINFLEREPRIRQIEIHLEKYILEEVENAKTVYSLVLRYCINFECIFPDDPVEQAKLIVCENPDRFPSQLVDWATSWGNKRGREMENEQRQEKL